jgi:hypothetical protein
MANVNILMPSTPGNIGVQLTVGRATTSGATASNSTNVVSNTSSLTLPVSGNTYYMASLPPQGDTAGHEVNLNGFALDTPAAGTFYYTIWMSSTTSTNYSTMSAMLTVLNVRN